MDRSWRRFSGWYFCQSQSICVRTRGSFPRKLALACANLSKQPPPLSIGTVIKVVRSNFIFVMNLATFVAHTLYD